MTGSQGMAALEIDKTSPTGPSRTSIDEFFVDRLPDLNGNVFHERDVVSGQSWNVSWGYYNSSQNSPRRGVASLPLQARRQNPCN
jgi:hypothetical protein